MNIYWLLLTVAERTKISNFPNKLDKVNLNQYYSPLNAKIEVQDRLIIIDFQKSQRKLLICISFFINKHILCCGKDNHFPVLVLLFKRFFCTIFTVKSNEIGKLSINDVLLSWTTASHSENNFPLLNCCGKDTVLRKGHSLKSVYCDKIMIVESVKLKWSKAL